MLRKLLMGYKELMRAKVMEMVEEKELTLKEASLKLNLSYRQTKRVYSASKKDRIKGLVHGNQGRASNNQKPAELKERVLHLYESQYEDFGPTLAAEKMLLSLTRGQVLSSNWPE